MHIVNMVAGSFSFHVNSLKEANCSKCFCIGGFSLKKNCEVRTVKLREASSVLKTDFCLSN